jgi:SlyX protein
MTKPAEDRIAGLEMLAAEQEKTIGELSDQIAQQWQAVDRMQKKLDALTERFLALEEQTAPEIPVTKPPHW